MDTIQTEEDAFYAQLIPPAKIEEVTAVENNASDHDSDEDDDDADSNEDDDYEVASDESDDDMSILELAMAKAIANVKPTLIMHFLCPNCGEAIKTNALWQKHLDTVHFFNNVKMLPGIVEGETFCCIECNAEFNYLNYRQILQHCLSHMPYSSYYKCSLCEHLESTADEMARHIKRHMDVHMLKAKINGKILNAKRFPLSEAIDYKKFLLFMCPECRQTFRPYDKWLQHVNDEHNLYAEDKLKFKIVTAANEGNEAAAAVRPSQASHHLTTCELCTATLLVNNLQRAQHAHYLTHLRNRAFLCAICDMQFNYKNEIKMHMLLLHCENIMDYEEAVLPKHLRPNNGDFDMTVALLPDKGERFIPYIGFNCPTCSVQFDDEVKWRCHINENHDFFRAPYMALLLANFGSSSSSSRSCKKGRIQPYCLLCDRVLHSCNNYHDLWREQLRHAPYRSYTCLICTQGFYSLHTLMSHCRMVHLDKDGTLLLEAKKRRKPNELTEEGGSS